MNLLLSRNCKLVLLTLYRQIPENLLNNSIPNFYGHWNAKDIHSSFLHQLSFEQVNIVCWQLHDLGYLKCFFADDYAYNIQITKNGILYCKYRYALIFKNLLIKLLEMNR